MDVALTYIYSGGIAFTGVIQLIGLTSVTNKQASFGLFSEQCGFNVVLRGCSEKLPKGPVVKANLLSVFLMLPQATVDLYYIFGFGLIQTISNCFQRTFLLTHWQNNGCRRDLNHPTSWTALALAFNPESYA